MDPEDQSRFAGLFKGLFERQLSDGSAAASERAYGVGFDDGWDYGSLVAHEWSYRRGYHEGFSAAGAEQAADLEDAADSEDRATASGSETPGL